jgi:hypothetical protein
MDNIKIIRMQSGEDIIASMIEDKEEGIVTLNNPMTVLFKRQITGKSVMMMVPWLPVEIIQNNIAAVYSTDVLTVFEPKESLVNYYNKAVIDLNECIIEESDHIEQSLNEDGDEEDVSEEEFSEYVDSIETIKEVLSNKKRILH